MQIHIGFINHQFIQLTDSVHNLDLFKFSIDLLSVQARYNKYSKSGFYRFATKIRFSTNIISNKFKLISSKHVECPIID